MDVLVTHSGLRKKGSMRKGKIILADSHQNMSGAERDSCKARITG
jgi:hypothetical protein